MRPFIMPLAAGSLDAGCYPATDEGPDLVVFVAPVAPVAPALTSDKYYFTINAVDQEP